MLSPANLSMKPTRAAYARMLAQIIIGLGISTGDAFVARPAHGQSCDRCAGLKSPKCGCEAEKKLGPEQWFCKCVPRLSLGEQLLCHFDKVGDRLEAKAKASNSGQCDQAAKSRYNSGQSCGCNSTQGPSCGCEFNSIQPSNASSPFRFSPLQTGTDRSFPGEPNRFATGSICDKHIIAPGHTDPLSKPPNAPATDPTVHNVPVERVPVEQPKVTPELTDLSDPPPAWAPDSKPPQKTNPINPSESKLPDVLVDPFKDDASFKGTRQRMEGILLTSDRQLSTKVLRLAPSDRVAEEESTPIKPKKPSRLSPLTKWAKPSVRGD